MSKAPMTMSAGEYRVTLDRLGLDTITAARLPGIGKTEAKRYAVGTLGVPQDVASGLRSLIRSGVTPEDLAELLNDE